MNKDLVKAELHTKWAIHQRLKTETYKTLATIHATLADSCQLQSKAFRRQSQAQQEGVLRLNYELQARYYQLRMEQHQEQSEQFYLIAFDSKKRAVAHEELAHYLHSHSAGLLKVKDCENPKQGCDRRY